MKVTVYSRVTLDVDEATLDMLNNAHIPNRVGFGEILKQCDTDYADVCMDVFMGDSIESEEEVNRFGWKV